MSDTYDLSPFEAFNLRNALPKVALSLRSPWPWVILRPDVTDPAERATLGVDQIKDIENRTWPTKFRGPVLVHCSKSFDLEGLIWIQREIGLIVPVQPMGGIVGVVTITDCVTHSDSPWFFGPYGFMLAEARPLPFMACKGTIFPKFWPVEYREVVG